MARKAFDWSLVALALWATGCSLTLDTNKKACTKNDNCGAPYVCEQGLCVYKTGCADDKACQALGAAYKTTICEKNECVAGQCTTSDDCDNGSICDTATFRCIAPGRATCSTDNDCEKYDGFTVCDGTVCSAAECVKKTDCSKKGESFDCVSGRCVDAIWGCIGEKDERPPPKLPSATYRVQMLSATTNAPVNSLSIKVCGQLDRACAKPLSNPYTYDKSTGWLTIKDLPQDSPIHLFVQGADEKGHAYFDTDIYIQRLVRDVTEESLPEKLIDPDLVGGLATAAGVNVNTANGTLIARIFDCHSPYDKVDPKPPQGAAGVVISASETLDTTEVFYTQGKADIPDPDLQATTDTGASGIVNLVPNKAVTIYADRASGGRISSMIIAPAPNRMTYINLYPRTYTTD